MRSRKEIKERLRQISYRGLQGLLRRKLKETPLNCAHNETQAFKGGVEIGVCSIPDETDIHICDIHFERCRVYAKTCPWFVHVESKDEIKSGWERMIAEAKGGNRDVLVDYAPIAVLLWVLDEGSEDTEESGLLSGEPFAPDNSGVVSANPPAQEKRGFWSRLLQG